MPWPWTLIGPQRPMWVGFYFAVNDRPDYENLEAGPYQTLTVALGPEMRHSPWPVITRVEMASLCGPAPIVAFYAEGFSEDDLAAKVREVRAHDTMSRPVLGVCDGFLPTRPIPGVDWLGLEAYAVTPTESASEMRARLTACMAALPPTQPLAIIGQAYDRAGWYLGDTLEMNVQAAELALADPRVMALLGFSWGRPGGCAQHRQWAAPYFDLVWKCAPPYGMLSSTAPTLALPTGVDIRYPAPADLPLLTPTGTHRVVEFAEPNDPRGLSARVELVNGSIHAGYRKDRRWVARSGKYRPVRIEEESV